MVKIDTDRLAEFADFIRAQDDIQPFDFCSLSEGHIYPPRNTNGVVEYFFFCCAHQFGFWKVKDAKYAGPMIASIDGENLKGSDYLWRCCTRAWTENHEFFCPSHLFGMTDSAWATVFADDSGVNPLPMWDRHLQIIRAYTAWLRESGSTPAELVEKAASSDRTLTTFLHDASAIPGYREDPIWKKLLLLAITLENRPEHFLPVTDPESYQPIIDYHLQRSALRTGLVVIEDEDFKDRLRDRAEVGEREEKLVRAATCAAVSELVARSGRSVAAIDYFFFQNRTRCPEMTEPQCPECPVESICAKETDLFQPVFRTTDY
ncbi:MAG: hypothetical protein KJ626_09060 [Verrucomicrobia bacterium]|nr:hypothetical protein [Verrucomicrobiota bacterium]